METKHIIGALVVAVLLISAVWPATAEVYGDKTCSLDWLIPGVLPLYICNNPDGGMDHSFLTYEAMNTYYSPPLEETYVPETTWIYGAPTENI